MKIYDRKRSPQLHEVMIRAESCVNQQSLGCFIRVIEHGWVELIKRFDWSTNRMINELDYKQIYCFKANSNLT